jgi:hypothetical protein
MLAPMQSATANVSDTKPGSTDSFARFAGHGGAVLGGVLEIAGSIALVKHRPAELVITLATVGILSIALAWKSFATKSRAAWAFLSVISAVMALCTFFGSAQLRAALGISFSVVMIVPLFFVFTAVMLGACGRDYREGRAFVK